MASHILGGSHDEIQIKIQVQSLDSLGYANDWQIQASLAIRSFNTKDLDAARHQARPHYCDVAVPCRHNDRCHYDCN
jgi:hypothetical protein